MIVATGSDHAGYELKETVKSWLQAAGHEIRDMGCFSKDSVDYPLFGEKVATAVVNGIAECGILICGTGIGMSIAANKVRGIRAALCGDTFSARAARAHNDANILVLGARVIGPGLACDIVETFLTTSFEGGRHQQRLQLISDMEERFPLLEHPRRLDDK